MNDTVAVDWIAMKTVRAGMMMKQHPDMDYYIARKFVKHSHIHVVKIKYNPACTMPQIDWCHKYLERDAYRKMIAQGFVGIYFAFKNDEDAVMFKLTWG